MENPNNRMVAAGRLDGPLELSHEVMNEPFYAGTLLVKRLSGAIDRLPVTIPGKLLSGEEWPPETLCWRCRGRCAPTTRWSRAQAG